MKVLKIMVIDGRIYHMPLSAFPDVSHVEVVDMHIDEYYAIKPQEDAFIRVRTSLCGPGDK